jgi:DNA-binding winged helix-turn-helix (wHTH) protein/Tol biopolymer transport system component
MCIYSGRRRHVLKEPLKNSKNPFRLAGRQILDAGMSYRFGPFRLDTAKKRLWRGDDVVSLTPKAFETLLVLVERAGQVVEKDEFLKAVWPETFVEEATLAQNISTLRKALGDTSDTPTFIATVPRRGYRFVELVTAEPTNRQAEAAAATESDHARERFWMAMSVVLGIGLIVLGVRALRPAPSPSPVTFAIMPPDGTRFSTSGGFMALSPDGHHVVFVATSGDGIDRLWIRSLDSLTDLALSGTDGASQPFWSPDSRHIAFFAQGKLKRIGVPAGTPQTVCALPTRAIPLAGSWNRRDDILFSWVSGEIMRVSAGGGLAVPVIPKDAVDDAVAWPQFLPDGRHFVYVRSSTQPARSGIYVGALDSTERTRIVSARSYAVYEPSGHLLFVVGNTLVAQRFDHLRRQLIGDPVPLVERVAVNASTGRGTFAVSGNGVLAYRTVVETQLNWFDRAGESLGPIGTVGGYLQFAVSPDATQVAASRLDPKAGASDIWIIDSGTGDERRVTFDGFWETSPVWSRDGATLAFTSNRTGRWEIYEKPSSGDGPERRIATFGHSVRLDDWSPDGRVLLQEAAGQTKSAFWLARRENETKPMRLPQLESYEESGRISPDGRWLAYVGFESGQAVYVRPLQSPETRWQVSGAGATHPRWRRDGRELVYLAADLSLMATDIEPGPSFRNGPSRRLFQTEAVAPSGLTGQAYDMTSDAQRFLLKMPASLSSITVIVNWTSLVATSR